MRGSLSTLKRTFTETYICVERAVDHHILPNNRQYNTHCTICSGNYSQGWKIKKIMKRKSEQTIIHPLSKVRLCLSAQDGNGCFEPNIQYDNDEQNEQFDDNSDGVK